MLLFKWNVIHCYFAFPLKSGTFTLKGKWRLRQGWYQSFDWRGLAGGWRSGAEGISDGERQDLPGSFSARGFDGIQLLFAPMFSKRKGKRTPVKISRYDIHLFFFASPKFHELPKPLKTGVVLRAIFGWLYPQSCWNKVLSGEDFVFFYHWVSFSSLSEDIMSRICLKIKCSPLHKGSS